MHELLKNDLQFPLLSDAAAVPRDAGVAAKAGGEPNKDKIDDASKVADAEPVKKPSRTITQTRSYLTIKPKLREILDRLEAKSSEAPEKPLFSTATELEPVRVPSNLLCADDRGKSIWRGKQIWDLASMLEDASLGWSLPARHFCSATPVCTNIVPSSNASTNEKPKAFINSPTNTSRPSWLAISSVTSITRLKSRNLTPTCNPIQRVSSSTPPLKDVSRREATQREQNVDARIDLVLDNATLGRLRTLTGLFAMAARSEVELAVESRGRHALGHAAITADRKAARIASLPRLSTWHSQAPPGTVAHWQYALPPFEFIDGPSPIPRSGQFRRR